MLWFANQDVVDRDEEPARPLLQRGELVKEVQSAQLFGVMGYEKVEVAYIPALKIVVLAEMLDSFSPKESEPFEPANAAKYYILEHFQMPAGGESISLIQIFWVASKPETFPLATILADLGLTAEELSDKIEALAFPDYTELILQRKDGKWSLYEE